MVLKTFYLQQVQEDRKINSVSQRNKKPKSIIWDPIKRSEGFRGAAGGKQSACQCGDVRDRVRPLGQEDHLEESIATHSSIVAWKIPWTEEPGGLSVHRVEKSQTQLKQLSRDAHKNELLFNKSKT